MKSDATTPRAYLAALPADRREVLETVLGTLRKRMPKGYVETMGYGMITWVVPAAVRPATYNGQPLMYAALANQKQHMAVYLMCGYGNPKAKAALREAYAKAGKKLDMGGSCVRFRSLDQLHLPAIGDAVASCPMEHYLAGVDAVFAGRKLKPVPGAPAAKATAKPKAARKARAAAGAAAKESPRRPAARGGAARRAPLRRRTPR